ncbi:MAG: YggS family pyridoxal phosphate-dependent enzyme [Proteobacteria bacterium]|nr:YggS family pyridoxal phosphate-dependent enzyme [Pseudomonadota bacterium]MCH8095930.1 YggS family pyridoxal phosphate-dependent enzyme [Pseudomonadota bacterium]
MPQIRDCSDIATNLATVRALIAAAAEAKGRRGDSVTLIAVSKAQPVAKIDAALGAGHKVFGENRVQEAKAKWPEIKARHGDVELHLIGPLQTNKVRDAMALFDVIETVDRAKLARALAAEMARSGRRVPCYIQVNTGEEAQKSGIGPEEADDFIALCRQEIKLPVAGLMCIPPIDEEPALHFALLREIARRNRIDILSMGMSVDFETAIRFGATHVRVGRAVFGARETGAATAAVG